MAGSSGADFRHIFLRGADFPVFSNGSFEEEGNSGVDSFWRVEAVLVWNMYVGDFAPPFGV